jgi:hypothetical protein
METSVKLASPFLALILALASIDASALDAARHDCTRTPAPFASTVETKIGFVNHSPWPMRLYRQTTTAARELIRELAPSDGVSLKGKLGDVWELAFADRDSCAYKYTGYNVPSTVSFAGVWNQRLSCAAEVASSQVAGPETTISFRNSSAVPVQIYWVNREGQRQPFGQLIAPGGFQYDLRTFTDHVWVATTESGECLAVFRAYDKLWGDIR